MCVCVCVVVVVVVVVLQAILEKMPQHISAKEIRSCLPFLKDVLYRVYSKGMLLLVLVVTCSLFSSATTLFLLSVYLVLSMFSVVW